MTAYCIGPDHGGIMVMIYILNTHGLPDSEGDDGMNGKSFCRALCILLAALLLQMTLIAGGL